MVDCLHLEALIKNKKSEEVFLHLQECQSCREKYLLQEAYKLLPLLDEIEREESYWIKQRAAIIGQLKKKEKMWMPLLLRYAAIILIIVAIVLMIDVRRQPLPDKRIGTGVSTIKEEKEIRPIIEEVKNPDARLYKIELDEKTHLIMLVDSNINL